MLANLGETRRLTTACVARLAIVAALSAASFSTARGDELETRQLLNLYRCYICHADREAKAGPAYVDVAAAFRARQDAVSVIAAEIRRGVRRGGPWHMPPHPEVSPREARAMARYIMSLDEGRTSAVRR